MAKLPSAFNANEHEGTNDYEALPAGDYIVRVVESEWKDNSPQAKDPDGKKLSLTLKLDDGQKFEGRQLWVNLNLVNLNPKAVEIAQNELADIARAVGVGVVKDSEQLHGKPFKVRLAVVKDSRGDDYPPQNKIRKYLSIDDNSPAPSGSSGSSSEGKKKPKWMED